jgi:hypothetical protein
MIPDFFSRFTIGTILTVFFFCFTDPINAPMPVPTAAAARVEPSTIFVCVADDAQVSDRLLVQLNFSITKKDVVSPTPAPVAAPTHSPRFKCVDDLATALLPFMAKKSNTNKVIKNNFQFINTPSLIVSPNTLLIAYFWRIVCGNRGKKCFLDIPMYTVF